MGGTSRGEEPEHLRRQDCIARGRRDSCKGHEAKERSTPLHRERRGLREYLAGGPNSTKNRESSSGVVLGGRVGLKQSYAMAHAGLARSCG